MSSSGLIYAVIVGAWAAYLVPMWLRRQDELNEARPTERFSTAIRLLSGRAGMERRYAKDLRARTEGEEPKADPDAATESLTGSVDVRAFAVSEDGEQRGEQPRPREQPREPRQEQRPARRPAKDEQAAKAARAERAQRAARSEAAAAAARARRSKVLARRRRTTVVLFLAFTLGSIVAAVGGLALLWAPGVPAVLLSTYIVYLRAQERRRYTYTMDRRRAEAAARQLRERRPAGRRPAPAEAADAPAEEGHGADSAEKPGLSALAADRRALVEQTDHAEWVDQQRERDRGAARGDSWEPVPVPLPTYVTAPVAPRATGSIDLSAPDTWSSARSSAAGQPKEAEAEVAAKPAEEEPRRAARSGNEAPARRAAARRSRERGRTPLFDQYAEGDRPRAANE
ncbi:hypothetical protein RCO28_30530 [Streptomyces sp. LHD-70]|uniref:divisome protein SepX/GlpR n=1 Tax=Streptomyces sp. LHD-70 TaxID=3072140 RepID=UPI00280FCD52|nr:gephyrin-like molybdotransferase receptor GlpR [Streptomyces sp. LHD-70]MDQ8706775.1 hypothetical protein [Streptomyces sp. LHD-70]